MRPRIMFQNFSKHTRVTIKSLSQHKEQNKLVPITQRGEAFYNKPGY